MSVTLNTDVLASSTISGKPNGMLKKMSTQNKTFSEFTYCSDELSTEEALKSLGFNQEHENQSSPVYHEIKAGQRVNHWYKNCVAFGSASVDFPSLEVSGLQLVQENKLLLNYLIIGSILKMVLNRVIFRILLS